MDEGLPKQSSFMSKVNINTVLLLILILLIIGGVIVIITHNGSGSTNKDNTKVLGSEFGAETVMQKGGATYEKFAETQKSVPYPLYFPAKIPEYFFLDRANMDYSGGVLIFSIIRQDGKKIIVTEQVLPSDFAFDSIDGLVHNIPGIGKVVIGSGFQGQRAVLVTDKTLIILSGPSPITASELQTISYSFLKVN